MCNVIRKFRVSSIHSGWHNIKCSRKKEWQRSKNEVLKYSQPAGVASNEAYAPFWLFRQWRSIRRRCLLLHKCSKSVEAGSVKRHHVASFVHPHRRLGEAFLPNQKRSKRIMPKEKRKKKKRVINDKS